MARKSLFCIATSRSQADQTSTKAPECALAGAGTGGVIGGTMGWIAGIGALAIPGVDLFIAAGPIIASLSGVAIGATIGGIAGALIGQRIPEIAAKRYDGRIQAEDILASDRTQAGETISQTKATDLIVVTGSSIPTPAGRAKSGVTTTPNDTRCSLVTLSTATAPTARPAITPRAEA
jgi:hypothetical protein